MPFDKSRRGPINDLEGANDIADSAIPANGVDELAKRVDLIRNVDPSHQYWPKAARFELAALIS